MIADDTKTANSNAVSSPTPELSTKDKISNIAIGAATGLMVGGAVLVVGGAAACVVGYSSASIPFLAATGKQTVAWGILAYDVFPITVAPFLGMEMEALEYPS